MKTNSLPFKISIAKPCPARWEDMGGDQRVRFCDHCRKNVYNISAMSAAEATALLHEQNGNLCARIFQRADGTVLTEDCPVGVAQYWRRVKHLVAGGVTVLLLAAVNITALASGNKPVPRPRSRMMTAIDDAKDKVQDWVGLTPKPILMGKICVRPVSATPPPNPAVLGGASVTPLTPPTAK